MHFNKHLTTIVIIKIMLFTEITYYLYCVDTAIEL